MEREDPIVAEVHRVREVIAERCNFDIHAYFVALREDEKKARIAASLANKRVPQSKLILEDGALPSNTPNLPAL